jgi:AcrR family transcriptional regulator
VTTAAGDDRAEGGHGGRPRDPSRDEAIREAALELLAEVGYDRLTIDAVAERAGAGKATVYRRWGSKGDLVVDALADLEPAGQLPDTGSLRGDLEHLCVQLSAEPESRTLAVMQGLASAISRDQTVMAAFNARFVAPRRAAMAEVFSRAQARGEMPAGKDLDLLTSVIPALLLHRLLTAPGEPSPDLPRRIVDEILIPASLSPAPATIPRKDRR